MSAGKYHFETYQAGNYDRANANLIPVVHRFANGDISVEYALTAQITPLFREWAKREGLLMDAECIVHTYKNIVIKEGDTPQSLGMKCGDVIHSEYTNLTPLVFVGETGDRVPVYINDMADIKMKQIFSWYVEKISLRDERDVQLKSLRFSYDNSPLFISSIGNKTPQSLGLEVGAEIHVSERTLSEEVNSPTTTTETTKTNSSKGSKKRSKGKKKRQNGADANEAIYPWKKEWAYLLRGRITDDEGAVTCNHGCDALDSRHVVSKFIDTFFDAIHRSSQDCHKSSSNHSTDILSNYSPAKCAMRATYEKHQEVWMYDKLRRLAIQKLVTMGTNSILAGNMNANIACAIVHLERFKLVKGLEFGELTQETILKLKKLVDGRERELIRFYSKRITCSCLKQQYAEVKAVQKKTGICRSCEERKDRNSLMVCSVCSFDCYCSRSCQVAHWPIHKYICKRIRSSGNLRTVFTDHELSYKSKG